MGGVVGDAATRLAAYGTPGCVNGGAYAMHAAGGPAWSWDMRARGIGIELTMGSGLRLGLGSFGIGRALTTGPGCRARRAASCHVITGRC